jgi:hypothetical protein
MRVTVRVEITDSRGQVTTVERTVVPTGFGDNPIFFGDVAEQASLAARQDVVDALTARLAGRADRRVIDTGVTTKGLVNHDRDRLRVAARVGNR